MGLNTRFGKVTDLTGAPNVITWTANAPTAGNAQTIANGASPTVIETGQAIQNINTILTAVIADLATLKAQLNQGE